MVAHLLLKWGGWVQICFDWWKGVTVCFVQDSQWWDSCWRFTVMGQLLKIHCDGTVVEDSLWWARVTVMGQLLKIHCDEQDSLWWTRFIVMGQLLKIHCDEQDSQWWDSCWRFTVMSKIHCDWAVFEDSLWWTRFTVMNRFTVMDKTQLTDVCFTSVLDP